MLLSLLISISRFCTKVVDRSPFSQWSRTPSRNKYVTWIKSLFAIYDIDKLVDLDVPWWSFKAKEYIENRFESYENVKVFEWGQGASTLWMAKLGFDVKSVEHDPNWAKMVKTKAESRGLTFESLVIQPQKDSQPRIGSQKKGFDGLDFENYVNAIEDFGNFDLIIIDGRARVECAKIARQHLNPRGILLFDNSNRKRYKSTIATFKLLRKCNGLTPASPIPTETVILGI